MTEEESSDSDFGTDGTESTDSSDSSDSESGQSTDHDAPAEESDSDVEPINVNLPNAAEVDPRLRVNKTLA